MIYRFAADGSGQVVSEAKRADLESFMGQHFPASDIPQQARQLYLLNPIRLVSDSSGARHPIEPVLDDDRRAARPVLCASAQRFADPLRISAQYGRRGVDVGLDHPRRRACGG